VDLGGLRISELVARRRAVVGRGGARRSTRGRGVAPVRCRHDVHVVGRPPVRPLRRCGAERGNAADRRPARADGRVRGRRLGEGDASDRLRGHHRRTGCHERRERHDRGVDERVARRGAGRAGAAASLGIGLAAGARSCADRRVGHQARGHGYVGGVDRRRGAGVVSGREHSASRTGVRRHPARRVRSRPRRPRAHWCRGRRVRGPGLGPRARRRCGDARREARIRSAAAGAPRRRRRLLGARRGADARVRRAGEGANVRERHGSRIAARRSRAGVLACAFARAETGRSRARRRNPARFPARLRAIRRRAGRPRVRRAIAGGRARRPGRVDGG